MEISVDGHPMNVYIFVADALRFDSVPSTLAERGPLVKTVSSSPLSCSAFTSLFTGLYPPQHGVWRFSDRLATNHRTIFDLTSTMSPTYMLETITDGMDDVIQYTDLDRFVKAVRTTDEPFIVVDRELCTHAPYGYDMAVPEIPNEEKEFTSLSEYWSARSSDPDQLRTDYERGANLAAERFEDRMTVLRDRGVLEDTLVIFTADHGEVLGEYGMYGHAPTLTSESVYVPTLFFDDGISVDVEGEFMAHVDLFPTLCSLFGESVPDGLPGYDLTTGAPDSRLVFNAKRRTFQSWGAWDRSGGFTFSDHGLKGGLLSGINRLVRTEDAPLNRNRPFDVLHACFNRERVFGSPEHSKAEARTFCDRILAAYEPSMSREIDDTAKERLQALGYTDDEIG